MTIITIPAMKKKSGKRKEGTTRTKEKVEVMQQGPQEGGTGGKVGALVICSNAEFDDKQGHIRKRKP